MKEAKPFQPPERKLWLITLIIGSLAFGIFNIAMTGGDYSLRELIAQSIGAALAPAIIPLIWLAILRFDLGRAAGALWTWSILLVVISGLIAAAEVEKRGNGVNDSRISKISTGDDVQEALFQSDECDFQISFPQEPKTETRRIAMLGGYFDYQEMTLMHKLSDGGNVGMQASCVNIEYALEAMEVLLKTEENITQQLTEYASDNGIYNTYIEILETPYSYGGVLYGKREISGNNLTIIHEMHYGSRSLFSITIATSNTEADILPIKTFRDSLTPAQPKFSPNLFEDLIPAQ